MHWAIALVGLFLAGSVFGYCFEGICFDKYEGDANLRAVFNCSVPLLMIYGASLVLLWLVGKQFSNLSLVPRAALAAIIITGLEYVCGKASLALHGEHTWSYADWPLSFGDDYCSAPASLGWFIIALLFFGLIKQ